MNSHRAHTEILLLAVAAVLVLLVSLSTKAPVQAVMPAQVSSQSIAPVSAHVPQAPAQAIQAKPATLQTISATNANTDDSDWVRADSVQAPAKQTRWVF